MEMAMEKLRSIFSNCWKTIPCIESSTPIPIDGIFDNSFDPENHIRGGILPLKNQCDGKNAKKEEFPIKTQKTGLWKGKACGLILLKNILLT